MSEFTAYFPDGTRKIVDGNTPEDALIRMGYDGKLIERVFFENGHDKDWHWTGDRWSLYPPSRMGWAGSAEYYEIMSLAKENLFTWMRRLIRGYYPVTVEEFFNHGDRSVHINWIRQEWVIDLRLAGQISPLDYLFFKKSIF